MFLCCERQLTSPHLCQLITVQRQLLQTLLSLEFKVKHFVKIGMYFVLVLAAVNVFQNSKPYAIILFGQMLSYWFIFSARLTLADHGCRWVACRQGRAQPSPHSALTTRRAPSIPRRRAIAPPHLPTAQPRRPTPRRRRYAAQHSLRPALHTQLLSFIYIHCYCSLDSFASSAVASSFLLSFFSQLF